MSPDREKKTEPGKGGRAVPLDVKDRLVVALDFDSGEQALEMARQLGEIVSIYKVGIELHAAEGNDVVRSLISSGKRIFLDLKYFDVPETIERGVRKVASMGVSFLTIHGHGPNVRAAVRGRGSTDLKLLSVTVLTSLDASDVQDLFGCACSVEDLVLKRAAAALAAGCDGVIASGQEASKIRQLVGDKLLIVTPGIRPEGFLTDDQKRRVTPREAIVVGADYLVVGRPITRDPNPRQAAERILAEMQDGLASRVRA